MKCKACNINEGFMNNTLLVCSECLKPSSFKMITKTNALEKYALTAKDLDGLRHAKGWSHYHNITCNLYIIEDIEQVAVNKYGSVEEVFQKLEQRNKKRMETKKRQEDIKLNRRLELHKHLIEVGLSGIRDDSILCQNYVEKGEMGGYTIEEISRIMLEMEFYYKKTNYRNVLRTVRNYMRHKSNLDYDEEYIREKAKIKSLKEYIRKNYLKHRKMVDEIPPSLKDEAFKLSEKYYAKFKLVEENKKNGKLINYYQKKSEFQKKKQNKTLSKFDEMSKQIQETLME